MFLKKKQTSKSFADFPLHVLLVYFYDSAMPIAFAMEMSIKEQ